VRAITLKVHYKLRLSDMFSRWYVMLYMHGIKFEVLMVAAVHTVHFKIYNLYDL
jgi:hypothetical protein